MRTLLLAYPGDRVALILALSALQAAVVILVAGLIGTAAGRGRAAVRDSVWTWALGAVLCAPIAAWAADLSGLSFLRPPPPRGTPSPGRARVPDAPGMDRAHVPEGRPPAPGGRAGGSAGGAPPRSTREAAPALASGEVLRCGGGAAFLIWCAGMVYLLARTARGCVALARLRDASRPVEPARIEAVLVEASEALGGAGAPVHPDHGPGRPAGRGRPLPPRRVAPGRA